MSVWVILFHILFAACLCQRRPQCPRRGEVKLSDPNTNHRFLQCIDGRGRWFICCEGYVFVEQHQDCLPQRRPSSFQTPSQGNSRRQLNSNNNSGRSMERNHAPTVDAQDPEIGPSRNGPKGEFEENRPRPNVDQLYSSRNHPYQDYLR